MCEVCDGKGRFLTADEIVREYPDWGALGWASRPEDTGSKNLVIIEVTLAPGQGHDFHKHPQQEEIIYMIEGTVEQWLRDEKQNISKGDVAFVPMDTVHASFNNTDKEVKILAILSPAVGDAGYELEDVSEEEPWNGLRSK
jgi:quercetin dioxygenase-like cupin family protein